jgi:hypothetical protein
MKHDIDAKPDTIRQRHVILIENNTIHCKYGIGSVRVQSKTPEPVSNRFMLGFFWFSGCPIDGFGSV